MRKTVSKLTAAALAAGLVCGGTSALPLTGNTQAVSIAWADQKPAVTFEQAEKKGVHTVLSDKADMYVMALSETDRTGKLELAVYGKLKLPYTGQDIDIADTSKTRMKPNDYLYAFFEWAPEDAAMAVHDKRTFKSSLPIYVTKGVSSIKMNLNGEEFDLKVPTSLSMLDTEPLSTALSEHRAEYEAAKSAGMVITPSTAQAFEERMKESEQLLADAAKPGTTVTQDKLKKAREDLNEAFAKLTPAAFLRGPLTAAIKEADRAIARIPELAKQGKGYKTDGYDAFYASYLQAKDLVEVEDLTSIVAPHDGPAPHTQRDFDNAAAKLTKLTGKLEIVDREIVDTSALKAAFFAALNHRPAQGKGWEPATARTYRDALTRAQDILNTAYPSAADVQQAQDSLKTAKDALQQVELDQGAAYTMTIRYRHHAENAPSHLIDTYFENDGEQVKTVVKDVVPGSEQRIYLDNLDCVRKFDGFMPVSFFYASDDGTLGKVRLFTGEDGRSFISFMAEANGDLDIKYVKGVDTRSPRPSTNPSDGTGSSQTNPNMTGNSNASGSSGQSSMTGGASDSSGQSSMTGKAKQNHSKVMLPSTGDSIWGIAAASSLAAASFALGFLTLKRR